MCCSRIFRASARRPWRWRFPARWGSITGACSLRRTCCRPISPAIPSIRRRAASSSISPAQCSAICSSRMSSTGRRPARSLRCSRPWRRGRSPLTASAIRSRSRLSSSPRRTRRVPPVRSCCRTRRWTVLPSGCPSAIRSRRTNAAWCSRGRASTRCRQSSRSCPGRSSLPCRTKPPRFTSKKSW